MKRAQRAGLDWAQVENMTEAELISVPTKESFRSEDSFYATFFHELVHSTGHEKRLNWEAIASVSHYASDSYSKEELTAEMGSAMLCLEAGHASHR